MKNVLTLFALPFLLPIMILHQIERRLVQHIEKQEMKP